MAEDNGEDLFTGDDVVMRQYAKREACYILS